MDEKERHAAGMDVRRSVLGDAHVNRAEAAKDDFDADFQDLITRYAWERSGLAPACRGIREACSRLD